MRFYFIPSRRGFAAAWLALLLASHATAGDGGDRGVDFGNLTIKDAIRLALANNLAARVERMQEVITAAHIMARLGEFDPVFNFSGTYESNTRPQDTQEFLATQGSGAAGSNTTTSSTSSVTTGIGSPTSTSSTTISTTTNSQTSTTTRDVVDSTTSTTAIGPTTTTNTKSTSTTTVLSSENVNTDPRSRIFWENNWRYETALKGKLPLGTEYQLTMDLNDLRNSLNIQSPPSFFSPEYQSFAGIKLTQPLLKDFGFDAQLSGLRVAQADRRLATLGWRLKVEQVITTVMKNYYDLAFAAEDIGIKTENIARARKLEEENRKRVEQGVGSQVDVQQAIVAASVREEELIAAQYVAREKANLLLRDLVADVDVTAVPRVRTVDMLALAAPVMHLPELMRDAFDNRIEYKQAFEQMGKQDIKIKFAKNQTWPRLDLVGSLGANGLQADPGSAVTHAFDRSTASWSAGVMVSIPLGNRQARAQVNEAIAEKEQLLLNYKQLEVDVTLQVDTAVARVETSERRLATARKSVTAASATLDGELKRLAEGVGMSFNVLEAQKDLAAAKTREIAARADLSKSIVELWLATGTLLRNEDIVLDDSSSARVRPPLPATPTPPVLLKRTKSK